MYGTFDRNDKLEIILCGTSVLNPQGGIAVVMPGYFSALKIAGVSYTVVPTYESGSLFVKWSCWLIAFLKIRRIVNRCRREDRAVIVYTHVGDGVSFFREFFITWWSQFLGAKSIAHIHSPKLFSYVGNRFQCTLVKMSLSKCDCVFMLTDWWKNLAMDFDLHERIDVVHNPLPAELLLESRKPKPVSNTGSLVVLTMARFVEGKGVEEVVKSLSLLPANISLILAGDGPLKKSIRSRVEQLGLTGRVKFTGWVTGEEKKKLLEEADIFCLPSTYDVFPMTMVEAMAFGVPVVAVAWGGIPDVVPDGRSGVLVESVTPAEIANAITQLMQNHDRAQIAVYSKEWVRIISSPEKIGADLKLKFIALSQE